MPDRSVSLVLASSTGGVGAHVRALTQGLVDAGWRVAVCGPAATEELFDFTAAGAQFRPVGIVGAISGLAVVPALHRAVRGSAIVHAHGLRAGTVAVLTRVRPLVVTWHNAVLAGSGPSKVLGTGAERLIARGATVTLAASGDLADQARALGGRDVRDGPIGIAPAVPRRAVADVRSELGLRAGQRLVLSIGRLHPQKGLDVLIAAAARWSAETVFVAIAGDGPLRTELAAQVAASGAPVHLLGRRADVADLLAAADLVVLPSRWEARSLAAQEALLAGRPLVATAVGGLPKLLGDGAILIKSNDVDALDAAVGRLLGDPAVRVDLAQRGRAQAATWPTAADTVAQVAGVYAELSGRT